MSDVPYFNPLTLAVRAALFGWRHPLVIDMIRRNAARPGGVV